MVPRMSHPDPIAIVSMAGIFPGAQDLEQFWDNIVAKRTFSRRVPAGRWSAPPENMVVAGRVLPDKAYSYRACLADPVLPDPDRFQLSPSFVKSLDPLYHMVLAAGVEAVDNSRLEAVAPQRVGTILAAIALPTDAASTMTRDLWRTYLEQHVTGRSGAAGALAGDPRRAEVTAMPATLLSSAFGFSAGAYTLDAACASSLFAVKLACDWLRSGRADAMLAGGVSRPDALYTQVGFSQLQALSPSGRCAPFDRSADGLVVGEGAGILVLKRLEDALRDSDRIWGVIRGIGLANDLRGNLLAPDTEGQLRAMRSAYAAAGWTPEMVDHIECHGAGTPLGDKTELNSLDALWQERTTRGECCVLGSIKSMIGHLLTAAGAAGLIKSLLALHHQTLPPTAHFKHPPAGSILEKGPFRICTQAVPWRRRSPGISRKAAVSAFGFGGINAHLLVEEWRPEGGKARPAVSAVMQPLPAEPVAIVGIGLRCGSLKTPDDFRSAIFSGNPLREKRPAYRWKGVETCLGEHFVKTGSRGGYIRQLAIENGRFSIPPNELPDILPQHLLMLMTAAAALEDAGLPLKARRPRMGAVTGMMFDYEATDFHLRWVLPDLLEQWAAAGLLPASDSLTPDWKGALADAISPPLTASRTLGALGGVISSRLAREFRLGGPSFVVSNGETSGIRALEIATGMLQRGEVDLMLAGAVDFATDIRRIVLHMTGSPLGRDLAALPFDRSPRPPLPVDGSCCLLLKRLYNALEDNDHIYSIIRGFGCASTTPENAADTSFSADYGRSLEEALQRSGSSPDAISLVEAAGSGTLAADRLESEALIHAFAGRKGERALGSALPVSGWSGAATGLFSVVKTSLCLHDHTLPPLPGFREPAVKRWESAGFHIPVASQYWSRNRCSGPRRALVASRSSEGTCMHVVMESPPRAAPPVGGIPPRHATPPVRPPAAGLFLFTGRNNDDLAGHLNRLQQEIGTHAESPVDRLAARWHSICPAVSATDVTLAIVAEDLTSLGTHLQTARTILRTNAPCTMGPRGGVGYAPGQCYGRRDQLAVLFPGSGNHFIGMGRGIANHWPQIMRAMNEATDRFHDQLLPSVFMPRRTGWMGNWRETALEKINGNPVHCIFGQVIFGEMMFRLTRHFGIHPAAAIGYSLGETAALFSTGAWPERGKMLHRMEKTDLFTTQLAGPCLAVRQAWRLPHDTPFEWAAAVLNRSADEVRSTVRRHPLTRLLIVNTPRECVIGGDRPAVAKVIAALGCEAFFLDGVVAVHCDAAAPVADAYRRLHRFPTNPPQGLRYYGCAAGKPHRLTTESAADAILAQAIYGFDYTRTIERAYADGIRIFVEMGPHNSCTRMVSAILGERPHTALSLSSRSGSEVTTVLCALGTLAAHGVVPDLCPLYPHNEMALSGDAKKAAPPILIPVGRRSPLPESPPLAQASTPSRATGQNAAQPPSGGTRQAAALVREMARTSQLTADAHQAFLQLSSDLTRNAAALVAGIDEDVIVQEDEAEAHPRKSVVAFDRDMCMAFAIGSVANVLGPRFAEVDRYPARVRLPDEPLMLVDRILTVEGVKGSLGSGRVVTEHDVLPNAWYLDGGRAPVCISVEAGQADLFLSSYLGIDLVVKGKRTYRLLDARVVFHRDLPRPGDVIRYDIRIDKFIRQGETHLFFFHFEGRIDGQPLISMTDGCAGFFTPEEVKNSGGLILTKEEVAPVDRPAPPGIHPPAPFTRCESLDETRVNALRRGELREAFGPRFTHARLANSLRLPGGRMKLIDRVVAMDPKGGRFGLGNVVAEADIHPDDWFLTCHFVDDMVMPGTLMYECCAHALRILLMRMGWISDREEARFAPVMGLSSVLRCRGR
jgi:acyl transferase domain-containing protein/3-hydroxymyristoyl/3-hydroxydecanoyl-(acyl carrier protein) dehydratase